MRFTKVILIMCGAVVLTAFGIDASDTGAGKNQTLLAQLFMASETNSCRDGMTFVPAGVTFSCIDTYEASADANCPFPLVRNEVETISNVSNSSCKAVSTTDTLPWTNITREQAEVACTRAGKRLPSSEEWYRGVLGTPEISCNVDGEVEKTGQRTDCTSAVGVYDGVGNVWEWVAGDVVDGQYLGRTLPVSGYVAQVDSQGMALVTETTANELMGEDYFWSNNEGAFGIIRGGYYKSKSDAGVYTAQTHTLPSQSGVGIGFRCVK